MNHQEKSSYLNAILQVMKQLHCSEKMSVYSKGVMNFANCKPYDMIKQRFYVIMETGRGRKAGRQIFINLVIVILFMLSFFVIVQPAYYPDLSTIEGVMEINKDNAYIRESGGSMILYVNGKRYKYISAEELKTLPCSELTIIEED